jgi:hypothetical protein
MTDYLYIDIDFDCSLSIMQEHKGHDGVTRREYMSVTGNKGFWINHKDDIDIHAGLILPCDRSVTEKIRDFMRAQKMMRGATDSEEAIARGPYYFTTNMLGDAHFESGPGPAPLFGGPDTVYAPRFADEDHTPRQPGLFARIFGVGTNPHSGSTRNTEGLRLARYNCWTGAQGVAEYIGGVDLGGVYPPLASVFRAAMAVGALNDFMEEALDSKSPALTAERAGRHDFIIRREGMPPVIAVDGARRKFSTFMDRPVEGGDGRSPAQMIAGESQFGYTAPARQARLLP